MIEYLTVPLGNTPTSIRSHRSQEWSLGLNLIVHCIYDTRIPVINTLLHCHGFMHAYLFVCLCRNSNSVCLDFLCVPSGAKDNRCCWQHLLGKHCVVHDRNATTLPSHCNCRLTPWILPRDSVPCAILCANLKTTSRLSGYPMIQSSYGLILTRNIVPAAWSVAMPQCRPIGRSAFLRISR